MNFKISIKLEEPLKIRAKVKVDSSNFNAVLPFESLIIHAGPFIPEGKNFEIKLNAPKTTFAQEPKRGQNGLIRNLWQKLLPSKLKQKPSLPLSHIIMAEEQECQSENNLQGGEVNEKNEDPQTENIKTGG